jgi:hypothetical protein
MGAVCDGSWRVALSRGVILPAEMLRQAMRKGLLHLILTEI